MGQSLFLGFLQGLTEFLPISSSGHLFLFSQGESSLSFVLLLHLATFFSITLVFFKDIKLFLNQGIKREVSVFLKFFVALLPSILVGLFLRDWVEEQFQKNIVALGFLVSGLLLASLFFFKAKQKSLPELVWSQALFIGAMQALAILPGFSRSALTIVAGLYCGLSPRGAVLFSFLISLPVILGSSLVDLSGSFSSFYWDSGKFLELGLAFLLSFITGAVCLLWLLKLVQKHKLQYFSFYLISLSGFVFLFL